MHAPSTTTPQTACVKVCVPARALSTLGKQDRRAEHNTDPTCIITWSIVCPRVVTSSSRRRRAAPPPPAVGDLAGSVVRPAHSTRNGKEEGRDGSCPLLPPRRPFFLSFRTAKPASRVVLYIDGKGRERNGTMIILVGKSKLNCTVRIL